MRNVIIYRHQLFRLSEIFISRQAEALKRFRPIYTGNKLQGEPVAGAAVESFSEAPGWRNVLHTLTFADGPLLKRVEQYRPALVHAHFGVDAIYAMKLSRRLGIPLVTTFHGFDATVGRRALVGSCKPAWLYYLLFRRRLAREGDLFICVSDHIRQKVLELGFPEERTVTHYIGIDTRSFTPSQQEREHSTILHVARLVEKKGTVYLIQAFSRVLMLFPKAKLVIIGEGPLRRDLEKLADSLGISSQVRFMGGQPHDVVLSWMKKATFLVLPSVTAKNGDAEGLGMVLLESAAFGVPVIATRHGGISEAVVNGKTGMLVPERDIEELADSMLYLLRDRSARDAFGEAARRMVEEKFDLLKQTESLEEMYSSLLRVTGPSWAKSLSV